MLKNITMLESFIVNAGTVQLNNKKYINKNINIYKSSEWLYCNVNINNVICKRIYPDELTGDIPYCIIMDKFNNKPSLLCNNAIIYQQDAWFGFKLEFIITEANTEANTEATFYECVIKDINYNNSYFENKN